MNSVDNFSAPVQVDVYFCAAAQYPFATTSVHVRHVPDEPDGAVRLLAVDPVAQAAGGDAPLAESFLRPIHDAWQNAKMNWRSGRRLDPIESPLCPRLHRASGPLGTTPPSYYWHVHEDLLRFDVEEFVEWVYRPAEPQVASIGWAPVHPGFLFEAEQRETAALSTWMEVDPGQLLSQLGLTTSYWCALEIPRRLVFGGDMSGDLDLLAGPLELDVTEEEWRQRLEKEVTKHSLWKHHSQVQAAVYQEAAREGRFLWPPRTDRLYGCEAKVSWYDPGTAEVRRTHEKKSARIRGQLKVHLDHGVDRVAFLHLIATRPRDVPGRNPWDVAAADAEAALQAIERNPLYDPPDLPGCGYFAAAIGAVPHAAERHAGSFPGLSILARPRDRASGPEGRSWRETLRRELGKGPHPRGSPFYIRYCERCLQLYAPHALDGGHDTCPAEVGEQEERDT